MDDLVLGIQTEVSDDFSRT